MTPAEVCAVPAGRPHVVVAVAHRAMRSLIVDLLDRDRDRDRDHDHDRGRWVVSAVDSMSELGDAALSNPDLVIVDTADFAGCCCHLPPSFALDRIVVIGPEPDPAYRQAALNRGAGGWLSRECVAEELCDALCSALACSRRGVLATGATTSRIGRILLKKDHPVDRRPSRSRPPPPGRPALRTSGTRDP